MHTEFALLVIFGREREIDYRPDHGDQEDHPKPIHGLAGQSPGIDPVE
mgnify:CR=1 FL=1